MATRLDTGVTDLLVNKDRLRQALTEINEQMGFVPDLEATPEKIREMMREDGIRPEENVFSRELIRMRYEED